ncbi:MAG TPA: ATP-grasp domain-containing protein [Sandaracinaceae bacterium LLY-WYZ-13_1]|nr:ATP-grasp domain-containing protein [Sandaracinaceae bacterium LLY-WYZ-13_1]
MTRPRLLLMGKRRGALLAAAHLDAEVILLDDSRRPARAAGAHAGARVDFSDPAGCVAAAREVLAALPARDARPPVDAVVALVERAVLPAAAVREALGVPGPTVAEAEPWRDKVAMKARVRAAGIATAACRPLEPATSPAALVAALGLPMVIKPRDASGSRGTVVARTPGEVRAALAPRSMVEAFVSGVEMSVESLVQGGEVRFENLTEYLIPKWANVAPAELPERVARAVRRTNRAAIAALGVRDGITHVEVFVRDEDPDAAPEVVFGELAARPPGGFIMDLIAQAWGFDPWRELLEVSLGHTVDAPGAPVASAGVWFVHPGEGEVQEVAGLDEARAVPGVLSVEVHARPGDVVRARAGVGEHQGRILARTPTREATVRALSRARERVRFRIGAAA